MSAPARVRGFATGDLLLLFGTAALLLALALPAARRRQVRQAAGAAAADVDSVRAAAERRVDRSGTWPATLGTHELPADLAAALDPADGASPRAYGLGWRVWEIIEEEEEPPPERAAMSPGPLPEPDTTRRPPPTIRALAGIVVHSADPRILAELLERYAAERSFVRDTTWTLLLGPPGGER